MHKSTSLIGKLIVIFKLEPEVHVLKFKHIIQCDEKLMRLKKRNADSNSDLLNQKQSMLQQEF